MLDLQNLPSAALMTLSKASPRREGGEISWDIQAFMPIGDSEEAETLEWYLPGAHAVFMAKDVGRADVKKTCEADLLKCEISTEDGLHLAACHCELISVQCKAAKGVASLIIKCRLHGLILDSATEIVQRIGDKLQIEFRSGATQLTMLTPKPVGGEIEEGASTILVYKCGEISFCGLITADGDAGTMMREMNETELLVDLSDIGSGSAIRVSVKPEQGKTLDEQVQSYRDRCKRSGHATSWIDVVCAIGEVYANGGITTVQNSTWELNQKVWDEAFAMSEVEL
tara:strand:- start:743 stop:1594 length:852 start_codon:yes stop_codon:yes gene_type:complete